MKKDMFNNSMLMTLIHHLDKKEFKELGLWVNSPIHNNSKNVIKLYDILNKKYRSSGKSLSTLSIMRCMEISPKRARQKDICSKAEQNLRQAMSQLTTQILNFLAWKKTQKNPVEHNRRIMDVLLDKQLFDLTSRIMKRTRKIQETSCKRDMDYCVGNYKLAEVDFYMNIILKNRDVAASLNDVIHTLEQSCLSRLLFYYCVVSNTKHVIKTADFSFLEIVKNYVERSSEKQTFAVEIYYRLLILLEDKQLQDYYILKKQLFELPEAFNTYEFRQLLNFMSNYCKRMIKQGDNTFLKEQFDVFSIGLQSGSWTTGIYFPSPLFIQIVETGIGLNKLGWTDNFLLEYRNKLRPDSKDDTLNYCLALVAFHKKDYGLAQKHLMYITTVEDFAYRLKIRVLLIKIYYDNYQLAFDNAAEHPVNNEIETLRKYVLPNTNKKMSETIRQQYSNFANFFKRILNRKKKLIYKESLSLSNLQTLQIDLTELKPLIERTWLEEKIVELIKEIK